MTEKKLSHDQLQSKCHLWLWNNHPELRQLFHANFNNLTTYLSKKKLDEAEKEHRGFIFIIKKHFPYLLSNVRAMMRLKSIGLVKGILDYNFYYDNKLHVFDFKVGSDKLSPEQKLTIKRVEEQGGKGYEIRSLEQFKSIIKSIIK